MSRKGTRTGSADEIRGSLVELSNRERVCRYMETRGIPAASALVLADRLEHRVEGLDSEACQVLLEGVADVFGGHSESRDALSDRLCEVREIERLMSAFAQELGKLDEVLEVLAAHVRRMRMKSETAGPQNFH